MKKEGGQNAFAFCHTLFFICSMKNEIHQQPCHNAYTSQDQQHWHDGKDENACHRQQDQHDSDPCQPGGIAEKEILPAQRVERDPLIRILLRCLLSTSILINGYTIIIISFGIRHDANLWILIFHSRTPP